MKTHKLVTIISIFMLLFTGGKINAQRVVVKTPRGTVVKARNPAVVYHKRVPAARVVKTVPRGAVVVNYSGLKYYYGAGVYYRYYNGNYMVIAAPIGIRVAVLPVGYTTIVVADSSYYYYQGNYYVKVDGTNEYEVVSPPKDITVEFLPEEAQIVEIDGKQYYEYAGTLYKVVITPKGKAFKVVGQLDE
ncbi:DUF6515 family protein [Lutibacter sp. B1]|uniref:DUF6515 family protein n=1 Tax=Lutibacter sp. B1 TaxID=2725996 RepID=UPI0014569ADF|nr:DUF6515 family protein [Lutibacter sp. B1]NLP58650.1 hypothetical protein [Lutibacter sp. B1]